MTENEWTQLAARIDAWWPATDFTQDSEAAYFDELAGYDVVDVERALRLCLLDGSRFAPSLAELLRALELADDIPGFHQAWKAIAAALTRHPNGEVVGIGELLFRHHAVVADFAASYGWDALQLEPVNGEHGGAVLHRMGLAYDDHVRRWRERRRQGVVQRQLSSPRRGELRKVDVLPAGRVADDA